MAALFCYPFYINKIMLICYDFKINNDKTPARIKKIKQEISCCLFSINFVCKIDFIIAL